MATKTADRDTRAERAERAEKADASTASDAKAAKADRASMTLDQQYEADQRERAESKRDATIKDQERRVGLTAQELAVDDAKRLREGEAEARRWDGLTQSERNAELDDPKSDHYEPLPPWQMRLSGGKVFDARQNAQVFQTLLNTDGTTPGPEDRREAMRFLLDYMTQDDADATKTSKKTDK